MLTWNVLKGWFVVVLLTKGFSKLCQSLRGYLKFIHVGTEVESKVWGYDMGPISWVWVDLKSSYTWCPLMKAIAWNDLRVDPSRHLKELFEDRSYESRKLWWVLCHEPLKKAPPPNQSQGQTSSSRLRIDDYAWTIY